MGRRNQGIRNGIRTLCFAPILGLAIAITGCSRKKEPHEAQDLESIRASLREQVASGKLTREEAVVRLAEATKEAKTVWMKAAEKAKSSAKAANDSVKETE